MIWSLLFQSGDSALKRLNVCARNSSSHGSTASSRPTISTSCVDISLSRPLYRYLRQNRWRATFSLTPKEKWIGSSSDNPPITRTYRSFSLHHSDLNRYQVRRSKVLSNKDSSELQLSHHGLRYDLLCGCQSDCYLRPFSIYDSYFIIMFPREIV